MLGNGDPANFEVFRYYGAEVRCDERHVALRNGFFRPSEDAFMVTAGFISFALCLCTLNFQVHIRRISKRNGDQAAKQASHIGSPLRLGGFAVVAGIFVSVAWQALGAERQANASYLGSTATLLILSLLPVFLSGLLEDWGLRIAPAYRLIAALLSGLLAVALLGAWAPRADIPHFDFLMSIPLVAVFVTVIFSAGICHALNLVDGMNGLAATVVIAASAGVVAVAGFASSPEVSWLASIIMAATVGFSLVNWPTSRLFLGDAGAYSLGHILAWLMILLSWKSSEVAIPALLLLLFWPLADVGHTIIRRFIGGDPVTRPDRMHLHQKVRRALAIIWLGYNERKWSNPLTTAVLAPFIVAPVVTGVLFWNQPTAGWIALGLFLLGFSLAHPLTVLTSIRFRKRLLKVSELTSHRQESVLADAEN
jgi:UDP-GlcNAc:undecaprenyl-phosphate GlcNAc-1-phosphate transferase